MGIEIERKFLVKGDAWKKNAKHYSYRQGYLTTQKERVVRVRTVDQKGYLTIKGPAHNLTRTEFEYEIPKTDADHMLDHMCDKPLIEKTRFLVPHSGLTWEIDEFYGDNQGLVVAEIELEQVDQQIEIPEWIDIEVSDDPRYSNSNLIKNPFNSWT